MILRLLKKDMLNRKGINIILFLFITLATVFLSSSVNNIMIVGSAVDYYLDYANLPEVNLITSSESEKHDIDRWLDQCKQEDKIESFAYNKMMILSDKAIMHSVDGTFKAMKTNGASLYLAKQDVDYNKVFNEDGSAFTLNKGEIAMPLTVIHQNGFEIGDEIKLKVDDQEMIFTLAVKMKDAAFGNDMVGMNRIVVSQDDYALFQSKSSEIGLYYIETNDISSFTRDVDVSDFISIINTVTIDNYTMVYSFDMIIAALLILIGICLILISLLVLRFTLVFTMEEQYQEIGIMKAIGIRNVAIKKLYLLKYLAIVLVGTIIGAVISFPISNIMIDGVSKNMIMESSQTNIGLIVLCAISIIALVLMFCYYCTRKLNHVSAITAIRGGQDGTRFHKRKGISLHKSILPVSIYLGLNDIISNLRRYAVLITTFCISFILITIPLNTLNTMSSAEMTRKFLLNPDSTIFVRKLESENELKYNNITKLTEGTVRLKEELKEKGYNTNITFEPIYFIKYADQDTNTKRNIMTIQILGDETDFADYSEGSAPILANEVAFSKSIMKSENWNIGDTVHAKINGETKELIITGVYSDYMQLGNSARLNSSITCDKEVMFDYWCIMLKINTNQPNELLVNDLKQQFPQYEWLTAQESVDRNVGGIQDTLDELLLPMTAMLCAVIMLITLLMEKLFITREKGEIAMLKSIGFHHGSLYRWQMSRMLFVVLSSLIISIPLSLLSNQFVLKPIFAIMGADVAIQVNALQAYLLYPCVLLVGIIFATWIAARGARHINIKEMNNIE